MILINIPLTNSTLHSRRPSLSPPWSKEALCASHRPQDGFALGVSHRCRTLTVWVVVSLSKSLHSPFLVGLPACRRALASAALLRQETLYLVPYANLREFSLITLNLY